MYNKSDLKTIVFLLVLIFLNVKVVCTIFKYVTPGWTIAWNIGVVLINIILFIGTLGTLINKGDDQKK